MGFRSHTVTRPRGSRLGLGLAAAGVLVASGVPAQATTISRPSSAACGPARSTRIVTFALSDMTPTPHISVRVGTEVEVISRFHTSRLTFPAAHPAGAVCEVSRHRASDGAATVVYRVLAAGTIRFSSSDVQPTMLLDPAMSGTVTARS